MSEDFNPQKWSDLKKPQLVEAAEVFGADNTGNAQDIIAALTTDGVTVEDYRKQFKLGEYKPKEDDGVTKSSDVAPPKEVVELPEVVVAPEPVTAEPIKFAVQDKYLIKMDKRQNPYFEFRQYVFTQENPYAILTAEDAEELLKTEEGFRQAFPSELQEFYG